MIAKTTKLIGQLLFVAVAFYSCCISLNAQDKYALLKNSGKYNSFQLSISHNKSTTLIFLNEIQEVISPSSELKATVLEANNKILDVVATTSKFKETSLFVLTNDGNKYSFVLNYSNQPPHLVYRIQDVTIGNITEASEKDLKLSQLETELALTESKLNQSKIDFFKSLLLKPREIKIFSSKKNRTYLSLENIFVLNNDFYLILKIKNQNKLNYSLKGFRASIKSYKNKRRREFISNSIIDIIDTYPKTATIPYKNELKFLVIIPNISFGGKKYLSIESFEESDDRNINIEIKLNALKDVKKIVL